MCWVLAVALLLGLWVQTGVACHKSLRHLLYSMESATRSSLVWDFDSASEGYWDSYTDMDVIFCELHICKLPG